MTGQPNDFAPDPVRTAVEVWGGGEACCPGSERADGGRFLCPTYCHGYGRAQGQGVGVDGFGAGGFGGGQK